MLVGGGGIDLESGLAGGFEGSLEIEHAAVGVGLMDKEDVAGVGALDGEIEVVVGGERVGGIDFDLALVAAIGDFERIELDSGAAALGDLDGFGFDGAAVQNERDVADVFAGGEAGDGGEHAVLAVVEDAARGHHVVDSEIWGIGFADAVGFQPHVGVKAEVVEIAGHAGLLHVGEEMHGEGQVAGQFGEGGALIGGFDGVDRGVEGGVVVGDFAHHLDAGAEGQHLGAFAGVEAGGQGSGVLFGLIEAAGGAHAERMVDGEDGDFVGA